MTDLKKCPKCKVLSVPAAEVCDCGYEFATGKVVVNEKTSAETNNEKPASKLFWWFVVVPVVVVLSGAVADKYKRWRVESSLLVELSDMASAANAQLPKEVEPGVTMNRVSVGAKGDLVYEYTLGTPIPASVTIDEIKRSLGEKHREGVCATMRAFVDDGLVVVYRYANLQGGTIGEIAYDLSKC